jgi:hypothetical protein
MASDSLFLSLGASYFMKAKRSRTDIYSLFGFTDADDDYNESDKFSLPKLVSSKYGINHTLKLGGRTRLDLNPEFEFRPEQNATNYEVQVFNDFLRLRAKRSEAKSNFGDAFPDTVTNQASLEVRVSPNVDLCAEYSTVEDKFTGFSNKDEKKLFSVRLKF